MAGFRYRLPTADASGRAVQVCALKIASIWPLHCFALLRGGFPQWFPGQLWLPFFRLPLGYTRADASRAAISR